MNIEQTRNAKEAPMENEIVRDGFGLGLVMVLIVGAQWLSAAFGG